MHGTDWMLRHVKRDVNRVAYGLAREAIMLDAKKIDVDLVISGISDLIMAECQHYFGVKRSSLFS